MLFAGYEYGPNLILNPGFELPGEGGEDIFSGWGETVDDGTITDTTTAAEVFSGLHAVKLTAGETSKQSRIYQQISVESEKYYKIIFYCRGDGTNAGFWKIDDVTNGWAAIVTQVSTGVTGTAYSKISQIFQAPSGCVSIFLTLNCPFVSGGISYFDEVSLRRKL